MYETDNADTVKYSNRQIIMVKLNNLDKYQIMSIMLNKNKSFKFW